MTLASTYPHRLFAPFRQPSLWPSRPLSSQYNLTDDNDNPRQWGARLSGWQQRANAAQMNGFEALPLFIAGVLLAQQAQADQATINALALSFIGIRVLYTAAYCLTPGAPAGSIICLPVWA